MPLLKSLVLITYLPMLWLPVVISSEWSAWKPSQPISFCSFLNGIELIYQIGDYLFLSASNSQSRQKQSETLFYVYNQKNGQLYGQPLRQSELFGESTVESDIPDGRLVFATTFDTCSLKLDVERKRRRKRRKKRQFDDFPGMGLDQNNGKGE